jgi:hypothetical protein
MQKFVFNVVDVIFKFGSLKRKPIKFKRIMAHLKLSKTHFFGPKKLKNKQKLQFIWTYENMVKF